MQYILLRSGVQEQTEKRCSAYLQAIIQSLLSNPTFKVLTFSQIKLDSESSNENLTFRRVRNHKTRHRTKLTVLQSQPEVKFTKYDKKESGLSRWDSSTIHLLCGAGLSTSNLVLSLANILGGKGWRNALARKGTCHKP